MPDIAKCTGVGCSLKEKCYRFTSEAEDYQAYFLKPPIKKNKCDYILKQKTNDTKKRK